MASKTFPKFTDEELAALAFVAFDALNAVSVEGASLEQLTPDDIDGIGDDISAPFALVTALRKIQATGAWCPENEQEGAA